MRSMERGSRFLPLMPVCVLAALLTWLPFLHTLDLQLLDLSFSLRHRREAPAATQVVLIGVDEATTKVFLEPHALWHRHLGDLFWGLAQARPLGVGLDLTLPDRSYDVLMPGLDAELMRGILTLRHVCPLVAGITIKGDLQPRPVHAPFLAALGPEGTGFVLWRLDKDNYVRRYDEHLAMGGSTIPTLSGTLARRLGLKPTEGYLDYSLGQPFTYVPLHEVVAWAREGETEKLRQTFGGKVVFIGSVTPLEDRHFMPVNLAGWEENHGSVPGVLLHAQAMRCFLGTGLIRPLPHWAVALLAGSLAGLLWVLSRRPWMGVSILAATWMLLVAAHSGLLGGQIFLPIVVPALAALAAFLGRTGLEAWSKLRERMRLRRVFGGYVSPAILKEILEGRIRPGLRGERRALCVLFSDIRNFTTLSERMDPEEVITLLNRYFRRMTETVHAHGGTLDKFIGDGIMAFFGAPEVIESPCRSAFLCAQAMLAALEELNAELISEGRTPLKIGVGLHFGVAAVGHVGSESRNEYTAIGDVVNTASRIEGLTKEAGYPLLVTAAVLGQLGTPEIFEPLGEKPLKGRAALAVFGWPRVE